jgi:soluble lytic murein transglycosylase
MQVEYPLDFVALLNAEGKANGLDPLFLAALIRQESLWDPSAGSGAGALGLTQVIPPTGAAIAASLRTGFDAGDLFRPAVSIRFGAYYIAGQLSRYGGPAKALAAYNAGPGNADRWAAAAAGGSAADFLESIDIEETQGYVASVLEHYARYRFAYRP